MRRSDSPVLRRRKFMPFLCDYGFLCSCICQPSSFSAVIGISLSRVKIPGDNLYLTNPSIHFRDVLLKHYGGNSVNVIVGW